MGQPVTATFVVWLSRAPFCPTNSVGIDSLLVQRFPIAASAEYGPWGSISSKLETGWSGTVLNVLEVTPVLLMKVLPTRSIVMP